MLGWHFLKCAAKTMCLGFPEVSVNESVPWTFSQGYRMGISGEMAQASSLGTLRFENHYILRSSLSDAFTKGRKGCGEALASLYTWVLPHCSDCDHCLLGLCPSKGLYLAILTLHRMAWIKYLELESGEFLLLSAPLCLETTRIDENLKIPELSVL